MKKADFEHKTRINQQNKRLNKEIVPVVFEKKTGR